LGTRILSYLLFPCIRLDAYLDRAASSHSSHPASSHRCLAFLRLNIAWHVSARCAGKCFISPTTNSSVSNDRLNHSSLSHHWKHLSMSLASYSTWTKSHAKGEKDWIPMFVKVVSFMTSKYNLSIRLMPVGHRPNWSARIVGTGACMRVCQSVSIWPSLVIWKRPFHLWELM
jgi:hypothetical protein